MISLRILIDLNIVVDALTERQPFFEASAQVLAAAETGEFEGWIAAHSVTTLFYLLEKDSSNAAARVYLTKLIRFLKIATVDAATIDRALALPYDDFEDAVQMMAAVYANCAYVVTRDRDGFKAGPLPAVSPAELLALIRS